MNIKNKFTLALLAVLLLTAAGAHCGIAQRIFTRLFICTLGTQYGRALSNYLHGYETTAYGFARIVHAE